MDKTNTNQILEKILNSPTFANKEVLKGLLSYLFESSKNGVVLKEIDIALDFFKRDNKFIPGDDTIVRVNIHKLRSLLEKYYLNEGKKDDLFIEIPKGSYTLNFTRRGQNKAKKNQGQKIKIIAYIALIISACLNLLLLFRTHLLNNNRNNPVWSEYIKSGQPVYITLGDPFFFRVKDTVANTIVVRDIAINNPDELKKENSYIIPEKGTAISELTYPYFSTSNVWPLPDIISIFAKENIEVRLQALSESNVEDINRDNEIFIANINSFGFINKFLEQTSIRLHASPRQIIINKGSDSLVLSVPDYIHGYYIDYAFLVKIRGPNENLITIMGDFHASGIKGLSKYITKQSSLKEWENKVKQDFGKFPEFFEMVVKVTSYNYSDFKTELIYFKPLAGKITF